MTNPNCQKCHGNGFIKEKDGSVHTCWACLQDGGMDQHTDQLKDNHGIKI